MAKTGTIGLAISGGVDSMALAALCSQLQGSRDDSVDFHAFVVDHGARPESSQEARNVSQALMKMRRCRLHLLSGNC